MYNFTVLLWLLLLCWLVNFSVLHQKVMALNEVVLNKEGGGEEKEEGGGEGKGGGAILDDATPDNTSLTTDAGNAPNYLDPSMQTLSSVPNPSS